MEITEKQEKEYNKAKKSELLKKNWTLLTSKFLMTQEQFKHIKIQMAFSEIIIYQIHICRQTQLLNV